MALGISLANAWGIFLIVFLLGFGLVEVPRFIAGITDYKSRMGYTQWKIKRVFQQLDAVTLELEGALEAIDSSLKPLVSDSLIDFEKLEKGFIKLKGDVSYEELVKVNATVKRLYTLEAKLKREIHFLFAEWDEIRTMANLHERTSIKENPSYNRIGKNYLSLARFYNLNFFRLFFRVLSVKAWLISLVLLVSEMTLFVKIREITSFGWLISRHADLLTTGLICLIPISYLFLSSTFALLNLEAYTSYGFYSGNNTDANSLLFLSSFMCRIGFPLCINCIQIMKIKGTMLEELLGLTRLIPVFGISFSDFFPLMLILFCVCNYFNYWGSLMRRFGLNYLGKEEFLNEGEVVEEGKEIMEAIREEILSKMY